MNGPQLWSHIWPLLSISEFLAERLISVVALMSVSCKHHSGCPKNSPLYSSGCLLCNLCSLMSFVKIVKLLMFWASAPPTPNLQWNWCSYRQSTLSWKIVNILGRTLWSSVQLIPFDLYPWQRHADHSRVNKDTTFNANIHSFQCKHRSTSWTNHTGELPSKIKTNLVILDTF